MGLFKSKPKIPQEDSLDIPPPPPLDFPGEGQNINEPKYEDIFPQRGIEQKQDFPQPPRFDSQPSPPPRYENNFRQFENQAMPKPQVEPPKFMDIEDLAPQEAYPEPKFAPKQEKKQPQLLSKPVFIELGKYKDVLKELNAIKRSLKLSDSELQELVGDIDLEEKTFTKLHSTLDEIEKKLMELEEGLFAQ